MVACVKVVHLNISNQTDENQLKITTSTEPQDQLPRPRLQLPPMLQTQNLIRKSWQKGPSGKQGRGTHGER